MQSVVVYSQVSQVSLLGHHSLQLRVTVDASVNIDGRVCRYSALRSHELLQVVDVVHFNAVLGCKVFLFHDSHPDLEEVAHLGHKQDGLLLLEVEETVAVDLTDAKNVVEERLLVIGVGHISRVEGHL